MDNKLVTLRERVNFQETYNKQYFQNCYSSPPKAAAKTAATSKAKEMAHLPTLRRKVRSSTSALLASSQALQKALRLQILGRQDLKLFAKYVTRFHSNFFTSLSYLK